MKQTEWTKHVTEKKYRRGGGGKGNKVHED
jgi:hypothetical protein